VQLRWTGKSATSPATAGEEEEEEKKAPIEAAAADSWAIAKKYQQTRLHTTPISHQNSGSCLPKSLDCLPKIHRNRSLSLSLSFFILQSFSQPHQTRNPKHDFHALMKLNPKP
jgi:hypothetical protein